MDGLKTGRHSYKSASCKLGYSQLVDANLRGGLRELSHLEATEPGLGHGTELLKRIGKQADEANITLMLTADTHKLAEWYAREFGFWTLQETPHLMIRQPYETQPVTRFENV